MSEILELIEVAAALGIEVHPVRLVVLGVLAFLAVRLLWRRLADRGLLPAEALPYIAAATGLLASTLWSWHRGWAGGWIVLFVEGSGGGVLAVFFRARLKKATVWAIAKVAGADLAQRIADLLFGPKVEQAEPAGPSPDDTAPPRGPSVVAASLLAVALALGATGCEMLPTLAKVASSVLDGVAFVRDAVTSADAAADAYFARHPNAEAERRVAAELAAITADLDALDAAAGEGHDTGPLVDRVIKRWPQFVALLKELRILSAAPPDGGPETEAPLPEPIELPTTEEVAARLRPTAP